MISPIRRGDLFTIEVERFQGPLDLLLHLIRQQDIDIFDIPIARITDQFLLAVRGIEREELDRAGEFLEMAATLIRIKARMLLPSHDEREEEDPRAELVRRLLEYEQIREIAARLSSSEAERARMFGKGYIEPRSTSRAEDLPLESTWEEVFEAALRVKTPDPLDRRPRIPYRPVAMEEKIELILASLAEAARVEFGSLVGRWKERMHGVMTFLAGLELGRRRMISLRQIRPFAELWLYRRGEGEAREDE